MDNIDELFKDSKLPEIDVKEKVMERIYAKKQVKRTSTRKRVIAAVAITIAMCFVAGFTVKQMLELKGTGGNKYTYSIFQRSDDKVSSILSEEMKKLNPGETVILLKTKDNPKNIFSVYTKPITLSNIDELKKSVGDNIKLPAYIPEGFSVSNCSLEKGFDKFSREDMIEEAKKSKETVIKKVLQPTDEIEAYKVMYTKGNDFIDFNLRSVDMKYNTFGSDKRGQSLKKVKVNDFEAAFLEDGHNFELTWLKNLDKRTETYSVRYGSAEKNSSDNIEKMLIRIAESIENKH